MLIMLIAYAQIDNAHFYIPCKLTISSFCNLLAFCPSVQVYFSLWLLRTGKISKVRRWPKSCQESVPVRSNFPILLFWDSFTQNSGFCPHRQIVNTYFFFFQFLEFFEEFFKSISGLCSPHSVPAIKFVVLFVFLAYFTVQHCKMQNMACSSNWC